MEKHIIYGPPGTGKTTKLLSILEEMLKVYEPNEIAFVSFTKKGVNEGRQRAAMRFGLNKEELIYFRTLHSMAFKLCGYTREQLMTPRDYHDFSSQIGMKFAGYYSEDYVHKDDMYLFYDILVRNNKEQAEKMSGSLAVSRVEYVTKNYANYKRDKCKYDFTDMIEYFVRMNKEVPVKVAIIDEAQDLTTLQWKMVECGFRNCEQMYIAGDDDQAIYEWSGADVDYFLNLKGNRIILDKSYRLPKAILEYSKQFTNQMTNRIRKDYAPVSDGGLVKSYTNLKEIDYNLEGSWLLLARNNYSLREYTKDLARRRLIYKIKGEPSIDKRDLKNIARFERIRQKRKYEKVTIEGEDKVMLRKCLKPKIDLDLNWTYNFVWSREKIDYYIDLLSNGMKQENIRNININTIHGVKGGEADHVVLYLGVTKAIADNLMLDLDPELRCLYVACTRAKKTLHLVYSRSKYNYERYVTRTIA